MFLTERECLFALLYPNVLLKQPTKGTPPYILTAYSGKGGKQELITQALNLKGATGKLRPYFKSQK